MNRIDRFNPILPPDFLVRETSRSKASNSPGNFKDVLHQVSDTIKFSNHCQKRLEQNKIQLNQQQIEQLHRAIAKAASKGSQESCVIMKDMVFIVNVANRTVKTVVDGQRMKENVFTNIDSAVII